MLSPALEKTLHRALAHAREHQHEFATLEHLLLALTEDDDAIGVMNACGVELESLRKTLVEYVENDLTALITPVREEPKPTAGFQRVLQRAAIHVQSSGRDQVSGANVLVALFSERESHAVYFLQAQDMSRLDAVNFISHGIAKTAGKGVQRSVRGTPDANAQSNPKRRRAEPQPQEQAGGAGSRSGGEEENPGALESYCVNLNEKALSGKIDPLIGREAEVDRTIQILCRRTKNNPLLCGRSGRRQDRNRGGSGPQDRARPGAGRAERLRDLVARHGLVAGRNPLPR